jgi:all-trans-retinol dehydrogenase (NAD+)
MQFDTQAEATQAEVYLRGQRKSPFNMQTPPSSKREMVVVITGAASGLGYLLAELFVDAHATVIGLDIDERGLREARTNLGKGFFDVVCDLSDATAISTAFEGIITLHSGVDVLINNAGIVAGKHLLDLTTADIDRTFRINVISHFHTTRAVLPSMIERGSGHIVTVASAGGIVATPRLSAYSSSKFAAIGFDDALRTEMKRLGHPISTTLIAPFFIGTGMFEGVKTRFPLLLPILKPERVARKAFRAIVRKKRRLIMPWFVYSSFPLRLLPVDLFDWVVDFFGITRTMDEFKGRG